MRVYQSNAEPHQFSVVNNMTQLAFFRDGCPRKIGQQLQDFGTRPGIAQCKLSPYKRMHRLMIIGEQIHKGLIAAPEMVNPDGRIGKYHAEARRRGGTFWTF